MRSAWAPLSGDFKPGIQLSGTLSITIHDANLFNDRELAGKMDPFLKLQCEGHYRESKVKIGGGKHPDWDEVLEPIEVENIMQAPLSIAVFDNEVIMKHDLVGEVNLKAAIIANVHKEWFQIYF